MQFAAHPPFERRVNHLMLLDARFALERRRNDIGRVVIAVAGKIAGGYASGIVGGLSPRQSFNAGVALIAHGEFTVIIAQVATENPAISSDDSTKLVAFAGLYVLVTATIGVILMKESKVIGRRLFRPPKLVEAN